jgi:LAO/AO transport system kinase
VELADKIRHRDIGALAQAIRLVEDRDPAAEALLRDIRANLGKIFVVGITGPPGSGKSTLCDALLERWRQQGITVGVVAVDPSSPFTGGALLGDRVRMQRHAGDDGVFIRSMATRGHLGGVASATRETIHLLDAAGFDRCLIETVGVGQAELEIMEIADTTVVVTTPTSGDSVQVIKAGIFEIADIFVINKADLPGTPKIARDLRELVHLTKSGTWWEPPIVQTEATNGNGIGQLVEALDKHQQALGDSGKLEERRKQRFRSEVEAIVVERAAAQAVLALDHMEIAGETDPYALADRIAAESN